MTERTDAQHHGHLFVAAHFEESAQVALSVPAEVPFLFLDMVPENVGRYDGDAALLYLAHLVGPFVGRYA